MEDKIEIVVFGLASSMSNQNTFTLMLAEVNGDRSLPIIIGVFEAQAIAMFLEKDQPPRPMSHDLIVEIIEYSDLDLKEVVINDYKGDTYYSNLIFEDTEGEEVHIDCRPSDAIAIAIRLHCPIFIAPHILDERGMIANISNIHSSVLAHESRKSNKLEFLKSQLDKAVRNEEYEIAARLRDEIQEYLNEQSI